MALNREVKRVPIDFDWDIHKVWEGYLNPYYKKCPVCLGKGVTKAREELDDIIRKLIYSRVEGIQELTYALADKKPEEISPFGLTGTDSYHIVLKILKLAGLPEKWGWCPHCKGEEVDPEVKDKYDNWKPNEPPTGKGFQCWETTSEGSPISPVFEIFDELCGWLAENPSGITEKMTKEDWKKALKHSYPCIDMFTKELVE